MIDKDMPSVLARVWLLGPFLVERRSHNSTWETIDKTTWNKYCYAHLLLKRLLCSSERKAERTNLIDDLWPASEPTESVERYPSDAAYHLRKVLTFPNILKTFGNNSGYALADQSLIWIDVDACETLLKEVERLGRFSAAALPLLEHADKYLQRGGFLEGQPGEWCYPRRTAVERMQYRCHLWLAEAYEQQGMAVQAEIQFNRQLEKNPADEDVLYRLMAFLHRQGMTQQALRCYEERKQYFERAGLQLSSAIDDFARKLAKAPPFPEGIAKLEEIHRRSSTILSEISSSLSGVPPEDIISAEQELERQHMNRSRRALLQLLGTSVSAALLGLDQGSQYSILDLIENYGYQAFFKQQLAELWDLYHTGGTIQAHDKLKTLFISSERGILYKEISTSLCMGYQLQGSLYRDMMKYDEAHASYKRAFEVATELSDTELMSAALARRGVTCIQQNMAQLAIEFLDKAHELIKELHLPYLQGYIFQALSEAHAVAQHEYDSNLNIDLAQYALAHCGEVPERSHCEANTTSVTAQKGVNAVHLHNYTSAITLIDQGIANYNPTLVRGRARLKAQQAEAYYGLSEIDACCQCATEAWILARTVGSNKTFARLRSLQLELVTSLWKREQDVIDLNWVMTTL